MQICKYQRNYRKKCSLTIEKSQPLLIFPIALTFTFTVTFKSCN